VAAETPQTSATCTSHRVKTRSRYKPHVANVSARAQGIHLSHRADRQSRPHDSAAKLGGNEECHGCERGGLLAMPGLVLDVDTEVVWKDQPGDLDCYLQQHAERICRCRCVPVGFLRGIRMLVHCCLHTWMPFDEKPRSFPKRGTC
jgi:hypothetical protein